MRPLVNIISLILDLEDASKSTDGFYNSHIYPMLLRCTLAALGFTYYSGGSVVMFAKDPRDASSEVSTSG